LLQEYFSFPQKFLFFDLCGLDQLRKSSAERFEAVILLDDLRQADRVLLLESVVNADTFQMGCTPVINLFHRSAEPIRLSHTKTEYVVIPDVYTPLGYEVYSVDKVVAESPDLQKVKEYKSFYSLARGLEGRENEEAFWFCKRGPSTRSKNLESDVFLSFIDRKFNLSNKANESITVKISCSNRDLSSRLKINKWGELDLESGAMVKARLVDGPTKTLRPATGGAQQWRLISHLSLNHLSLVEGGADALREILRLYDPWTNRVSLQQIDGLVAIRSTRKVARINSEHGFVFCPGVMIDAEINEEKFSGNAYLLASILERFFGLYCGVNSFTQLRVTTQQREGVVWQWPIRSGEQAVA
jgi:type VI secretion system protein ImpG